MDATLLFMVGAAALAVGVIVAVVLDAFGVFD